MQNFNPTWIEQTTMDLEVVEEPNLLPGPIEGSFEPVWNGISLRDPESVGQFARFSDNYLYLSESPVEMKIERFSVVTPFLKEAVPSVLDIHMVE